MMQSNGRRFYRVRGRSVIHSDIMDCLYHNEARTETVTLFQQPAKAGRFTCEFRGYVSFPLAATVTVLELASFKEPFCDTVFADFFVLKATTVTPFITTFSVQLAAFAVPPAQYIFTSRTPTYTTFPYQECRVLMSDGTNRVFIPTLTYIFQGSPEDNGDVASMRQWHETVYVPSIPSRMPAAGATYEQILALGWKERLSTFTRWLRPPL